MKNLSTILKLSLITFIILFSNSCKNKDCHDDGTCPPEYYKVPISDVAKSYLWGKAGSFWIYKNTKTGDLDTQTCTGFSLDTIISPGTREDNKHVTSEWERISRTISSSFNEIAYWDRTGLAEPDVPNFNSEIQRLDRHAVGVMGNNTPFYYPFQLGSGRGSGGSDVRYTGMDSTLTIQGKTYINVVKFDMEKDDIWDDKINCIRSHSIYYWAQNVGMLKKEMLTCNCAWELIEYKIIK